MRGISRRVLACDQALNITKAACRELATWWSEQEAAVEAARTDLAAVEQASAALEICAGCPQRAECARLLELDSYTGIGGGAVYRNGRRISAAAA